MTLRGALITSVILASIAPLKARAETWQIDHDQQPSYSCNSQKLTNVEETICHYPVLAYLDEKMARSYEERPENDGTESIRQSQRKWLAERNACGADATCIAYRYMERISLLTDEQDIRLGVDGSLVSNPLFYFISTFIRDYGSEALYRPSACSESELDLNNNQIADLVCSTGCPYTCPIEYFSDEGELWRPLNLSLVDSSTASVATSLPEDLLREFRFERGLVNGWKVLKTTVSGQGLPAGKQQVSYWIYGENGYRVTFTHEVSYGKD